MKTDIFQKLFIFEMANNHNGILEHGLRIIKEVREAIKGLKFNFGFKLQYRDLDSFIHPDYQGKQEIKYVKRFEQTRLAAQEFKQLKDEITRQGFISVCTPFDQPSVGLAEKHKFDMIKIGSCSFTDWPLLERIAQVNKPVIASCAGAAISDIDKVVSFFEHRERNFALMHCVAEYPTSDQNLQLNQIDLLRSRYPKVAIGYSTHEDPENFDSVKMAIAKGAVLFEKHVGLKSAQISLNRYSATPGQLKQWLASAQSALQICGVNGARAEFSDQERKSLLALRRGVFSKRPIKEGEKIETNDIFLAIPTVETQITANDLSKYSELYAKIDMAAGQTLLSSNTRQHNSREKVYSIVQQVKRILKQGNIVIPGKLDFEISHHYGIDRFYDHGATIINVVNLEYCKKLIVLVPGQEHPEQYHKLKEETFQVLHGDFLIELNRVKKEYGPGDIVTIERGAKHSFSSNNGAVVEEVSSTHHKEDSYYSDQKISQNKNRKTAITYWLD